MINGSHSSADYSSSELAHDSSASSEKRGMAADSQLTERKTTTQSKRGLHSRMHKPIFGRDGPGGHWYVRIPLWLQSTILIFFIGFLSILILTVVSATQVWSYTENLMQNRLSSLAGMTAIDVEQAFHSLERSVTSTNFLATNSMFDLLNASNAHESLSPYFDTFRQEIELRLSLSDCIAMIVYDKSLKPVYHYRKQSSTDRLYGQQSDMIPNSLFPLSNKDTRSDMVTNLKKNTYTAVLANTTVNRVSGNSRSMNITYSVNSAIPLGLIDVRGEQGEESPGPRGNGSYIGFCTFVMRNTISSVAMSEQLFPNYFVEIVRLNDVNLRNGSSRSDPKGDFSFMYPFTLDNGTIVDQLSWPVADFPVIYDGLELVERALNGTENNRKSPNKTENTDIVSLDAWSRLKRYQGISKDSRNRSLTEHSISSSNSTNSTGVTSTNSGRGNLSSIFDGPTLSDSSFIKTDSARMRTKTPFTLKASIGYSFANVYDQKWLVFVGVPESEAFVDARNLRNVVIGVGCGILGAVFLILLPLSRWQTRGFYVIYKNMKLSPVFFYHNNDSQDLEELQGDNAVAKPDQSASVYQGDEGDQIKKVEGGKQEGVREDSGSKKIDLPSTHPTANEMEVSRRKQDDNLPANRAYLNEEEANGKPPSVESISDESYRLRMPRPLPPLNKWYTDEVDDLVDEYNNMTEILNAHYSHLEDQVRSRTKEAQKARELREQANVAKSEFIAIISHELRTPLNGIMGLTAVSVDEHDITKIRSALEIVIESGHILMDLLNELLELSKSLIGVEPSVYDFTPSSFLKMLPTMFSSRAASLTCNFALTADPPSINDLKLRGDSEHVAQVCLNFMSNAMKFSDNNSDVTVVLHLRPFNDPLIKTEPYGGKLDKANAVLEILVTDSGVGISKDQLSRIFDLFVQGEDPLRKNRKGAGLGMALSKQLAEGIGGYVMVFSAKDVGTTSLIRAPVEVVGHTPEEVVQFTALPLEFKVKEVYYTLSLQSGQVALVKQSQHAARQILGTTSLSESTQHGHSSASFLSPRSRHSHHSSGGSRLLLSKGYPMSNLLRSHSQHHHNRSEHSSRSYGSQGSSSTGPHIDRSSSKGGKSGSAQVAHLTHTFAGTNLSSASLLSNLRENFSDSERASAVTTTASASDKDEDMGLDANHQLVDPAHISNTKLSLSKDTSRRPAMLPLNVRVSGVSENSQHARKHLVSSPLMDDSTSENSEQNQVLYTLSPERPPSPEIYGNTRVLVAEDNPINQEVTIKMLKQLGVRSIDIADDGEKVIKLVEQSIVGGFHYNVIFVDLGMPGISGVDAAHFIRTTLGYPYPIIALTGYSDTKTRNACHAASIQEVLTKPVMKADLVRVMHRYATNKYDPSSASNIEL